MATELPKKMGYPALTLFSICVVLVVDGLTASASIGPSSITWWLITLIFFVIPYGLISSELGTTYPGEGGIYDWVKRAFGLNGRSGPPGSTGCTWLCGCQLFTLCLQECSRKCSSRAWVWARKLLSASP